jgi:hypothetical protein
LRQGDLLIQVILSQLIEQEAGVRAGLFVWAIPFIVRLENKPAGTRTRKEPLIPPAVVGAGNA